MEIRWFSRSRDELFETESEPSNCSLDSFASVFIMLVTNGSLLKLKWSFFGVISFELSISEKFCLLSSYAGSSSVEHFWVSFKMKVLISVTLDERPKNCRLSPFCSLVCVNLWMQYFECFISWSAKKLRWQTRQTTAGMIYARSASSWSFQTLIWGAKYCERAAWSLNPQFRPS